MKISPYFEMIARGTDYGAIFGPNWETLNNFYLFYEQLNNKHKDIVCSRRLNLFGDIIIDQKIYLDRHIQDFLDRRTILNITNRGFDTGFGVGILPMYEIILMHKLIEDKKDFIYLPLFDNL